MGDLLNEIDFNAFEEEFKLPQKKKLDNKNPDKVDGANGHAQPTAAEPLKPKLKSLMEHTRLRNIAICTRKLPQMPIPDLIKAINSLDIKVKFLEYQEIVFFVFLRVFLFGKISYRSFTKNFQIVNVEAVELLQRMVPNEEEVKAYQEFNTARKDVNELTEEDKVKE